MEEKISKEWFVGFIEGEGNFHVALANYKNKDFYPFDYYPILQFRIFLREDDLDVLEKIQDFLGFGKIYKKKMDYNRKLGFKSKDQYALYVTNSKDLLTLKNLLSDAVFFTKKKKDIEIFFKIFDLKASKQHLTEEGHKAILTLANKINSGMRDNFKKGGNRNLYSKNALTSEMPKSEEIKA